MMTTKKWCCGFYLVFHLALTLPVKTRCFYHFQVSNSFRVRRLSEMRAKRRFSKLCSKNKGDEVVLDSEALFLERFKRRVNRNNDESLRPPNSSLGPVEFVVELLKGLRHVHHPVTHAGMEMLYESSTPQWRKTLCYSIGKSPPDTPKEELITCLSLALERPNHQFGILIGNSDVEYRIEELPTDSDILDYGDGTCWLETRLRNPKNDELLAVVGWSLVHHSEKSFWLLDGIDWQDFRPEHRPGIGREEWERICG